MEYLRSSVGDGDVERDELDPEDIEGVESSLPPVSTRCDVAQAGTKGATEEGLY